MKKRGFTLVELLVVIAIIGVLVALLLPAVQAAREAARRMQCGNHLKQIGLGLQNYHDVFNSLPFGARARYHTGDPVTSNNNYGPSWYVGLLPFCEQKNLSDLIEARAVTQVNYNNIPSNVTLNNTSQIAVYANNQKIPWMLCPSSPLPQTETPVNKGPILIVPSYVGIAGALSTTTPAINQLTNEPAFVEKRTHTDTAVSGGIASGGGMLTVNEAYNMAACIDGTSNTMIVSEIADYFWTGSTATAAGTRIRIDGSATNNTGGRWFVGTNTAAISSATASFGGSPIFNLTTIRSQNSNGSAATLGFNGKRASFSANTNGVGVNRGCNNPLLSAHPNVVLAVFMDGHTQGLQRSLNAAVVKRLATRDDGQQIADF